MLSLGRLLIRVRTRVQVSGASLPAVAVACVLCVGALARARFYFSAPSYWYDEAYLLLNLFDRSFAGLLGAIDHAQTAPPLYLWMERAAFLVLGSGELVMRLPAFVAGVLGLAVMIPLARWLVGGQAAWFAVALAALSRAAIRHGGEVKPYACDALASAVVLFLVVAFVRARGADKPARAATLGLLLAALVGPWLSFPAAFALGGAVTGLFLRAYRAGSRRDWSVCGAVGLLTVVSGSVLWWVHARHLYYPLMADHWGPSGEGGLPDLRSASAILWPIRCLVTTAEYGTRELGIVVALLAVVGVRRVARENADLAAALAGPFVLAVAASYLGKYPLANRTTMFLLPGVWLAAAAGAAEVADRLAAPRFVPLLALIVLAVDFAGTGEAVIRPQTFPEARTAFRDVRADRRPGDVVWVSHVEVYRAYHGSEQHVFGAETTGAQTVAEATTGRVWVIENPAPFRGPGDSVREALLAAGYQEIDQRPYRRVIVRLYAR